MSHFMSMKNQLYVFFVIKSSSVISTTAAMKSKAVERCALKTVCFVNNQKTQQNVFELLRNHLSPSCVTLIKERTYSINHRGTINVRFIPSGDTLLSGLKLGRCIFNRLEPLQSIQQQAILKIYKVVEKLVFFFF